MEKELYIGIMSGTSLDGIDVVLCEIDAKHCKYLHSLEYPMPLAVKTDILAMINAQTSLEEIGKLDHRLGLLFAEAVMALLERESIDTDSVTAIGSHGQTLWHAPYGKHPFSMQLGDATIISVKTGIPVIADFRRKDVALGGQGAPFAPAFHAFLLGSLDAVVLNIGGMANITVLDETLLGYDTGCGNVLLDMHISTHLDKSYDKDGAWAKQGTLNNVLLATMLKDEYFSLPYPKSTGREYFNKAWLNAMIMEANIEDIKAVDMQRTLTELTAVSIATEVLRFNKNRLMLCGGGTKNSFLVERLNILMPQIKIGVMEHSDDIEAMLFAWLAYKRLHKQKVNLKHVTGASDNAILGAIYE